jgi:Protein of unknown function (DUF2934)
MVNGMHNKSLEEKLRLQAYHLWEADGRPEGRSTEYWEKARVLLEQEAAAVVPVTPPDEAADASAITRQSAKKPVKAKSKVTPPGEESIKTPKAKAKAKPKDDSKVARKAAAKTAAKPKAADTAPKKPKAAANAGAKPKAIAEAAEKPGKKPAAEKAPAKPASKAAPKVSKTPKK